MQKTKINLKQIIVVILIVIAVFLLLDYQNRKTLLYQVKLQRDLIESDVVQLKQTEIALSERLEDAYASSIVEAFAREELRKGKPGDVIIIPMSDSDITPTPTAVHLPTPVQVENWEVWQAVLFK